MISTAAKVGLYLGAAAVAGVGIAVAVKSSSSSSSTPATPGVPPQGSTVWVRATTLTPGQSVRISVPTTELQRAAQSVAGVTIDLPGFETFLASPVVVQALGATNFQAWGPSVPGGPAPADGPALPADWPPDDVAASTEFHAQFVYGQLGASSAVNVAQLPIPVQVLAWVPKGTGA